MGKPNDGGPAFPMASNYQPGMSLRDWFAGQALMSLMTARQHDWYSSDVAEYSYKLADAMLAQREKETQGG